MRCNRRPDELAGVSIKTVDQSSWSTHTLLKALPGVVQVPDVGIGMEMVVVDHTAV